MKRIALLILALTLDLFAQGGHCENMFQNLTKIIPAQKVKICRVTGIDEERNDISGMFFYMEIKGRRYPAVFVYGTDFVEMLYAAPTDTYATTAKCIESKYFRAIYTHMTSEQIVAKMLSYKSCEEGFDHPYQGIGKVLTE